MIICEKESSSSTLLSSVAPLMTRVVSPSSKNSASPESGLAAHRSPVRLSSRLMFAKSAGRPGLRHGLEGAVGPGDVRRVVLRVVQLHDASADVRLERGVVVAELGKGVDGHGSELSSGYRGVRPPSSGRADGASV